MLGSSCFPILEDHAVEAFWDIIREDIFFPMESISVSSYETITYKEIDKTYSPSFLPHAYYQNEQYEFPGCLLKGVWAIWFLVSSDCLSSLSESSLAYGEMGSVGQQCKLHGCAHSGLSMAFSFAMCDIYISMIFCNISYETGLRVESIFPTGDI